MILVLFVQVYSVIWITTRKYEQFFEDDEKSTYVELTRRRLRLSEQGDILLSNVRDELSERFLGCGHVERSIWTLSGGLCARSFIYISLEQIDSI